jgi:hypothetical protein
MITLEVIDERLRLYHESNEREFKRNAEEHKKIFENTESLNLWKTSFTSKIAGIIIGLQIIWAVIMFVSK